MSVRTAAFFALVGASLAPAVLILGSFPGAPDVGSNLGGHALRWIGQVAPAVAEDASAAGLGTPLAVAGALGFLAPAPTQRKAFVAAVLAAALGWAVYLWLATSFSEASFRSDVALYLNKLEQPDVAKAKLATAKGFASTMRAVFLALAAALIGVMMRGVRLGDRRQGGPRNPLDGAPKKPHAPRDPVGPRQNAQRISADAVMSWDPQADRSGRRPRAIGGRSLPCALRAALVLGATIGLPAPTRAGAIQIDTRSDAFTERVEMRLDTGAGPVEIKPGPDGVVEFAFDKTLFDASAYAERILVVTWTPKKPNEPIDGVGAFSVEIPIVLRKWRASDQYYIQASPMRGVWLAARDEIEALPSRAWWTKALASLQQDDHFNNHGEGQSGETHRVLNTAVDGLSAIMRDAPIGWFRPPLGLRARLDNAFSAVKSDRYRALIGGLAEIEKAIWPDLLSIERRLKGETCEVVAGTFDYLDLRRKQNPIAYAQSVGSDSTLLDVKRAAAEAACAAAR